MAQVFTVKDGGGEKNLKGAQSFAPLQLYSEKIIF
jgi:hypothetical protein